MRAGLASIHHIISYSLATTTADDYNLELEPQGLDLVVKPKLKITIVDQEGLAVHQGSRRDLVSDEGVLRTKPQG